MKSIMWWFLEGSPKAQIKNLAKRLYYFNEGAKQRKRYEKRLAELNRSRPVYEVPEFLSEKKNNNL